MTFARARRLVATHDLLPKGQLVLAACSGGADSVALLVFLDRIAREGGFAVAVASVDHGLRPEAAAEVERVAGLAAELDHPFRMARLRLQPGARLQARARAARYDALAGIARELGASRIALGHTADDQAETVMARLLRGAGVPGLAAMRPARPFRDGAPETLIRPLLTTRRAELRQTLERLSIDWIEDPSNEDERFERVRVRRWLREAQAEDPRIVEHLSALAGDAAAHVDLVEAELERRRIGSSPGELAAAPEALRRAALRRFAEETAGTRVGRAHLEALEALVRDRRGEVLLPGEQAVRIERGELVVVPAPSRTRSAATEPPAEHAHDE